MKRSIPFEDLRNADPKVLEGRYALRSVVARLIEARKVTRREQILEAPNLAGVVTGADLRHLLRAPADHPDPPDLRSVSNVESKVDRSGLLLQVIRLDDGTPRLGVCDAGGELISADLRDEAKVNVRYSSARLCGYSASDLLRLSHAQRVLFSCRLQCESTARALRRIEESEAYHADDAIDKGFRILFESLAVLRWRLRPLSVRPDVEFDDPVDGGAALGANVAPSLPPIFPPIDGAGGGGTPGGTSNGTGGGTGGGCGPGTRGDQLVPDLNFGPCCARHDACYSAGCTECDRTKCDAEFLECLLTKGDVALAALYYSAVVAAGQISFNYCHPTRNDPVATVAGGAVAAGGLLLTGTSLVAAIHTGDVGLISAAAIGVIFTALALSAFLCVLCSTVVEAETSLVEVVDEVTEAVQSSATRCSEHLRRVRRKKKGGLFGRLFRWIRAILKTLVCILVTIVLVVVLAVIASIVAVVSLIRRVVCPNQ